MWHWLPSVLYNHSLVHISQRRLFLLQLFGFVFLMHAVVFLGYGLANWLKSGKDRFAISLYQQGATYVLMPLQKQIAKQQVTQVLTSDGVHKKSNVIDHETYLSKKKNKKRNQNQAVTKKISKKSIVEPKKTVKSEMLVKAQKSSVVLRESRSSMRQKKAVQHKKNTQKIKSKKSTAKIQEIKEVEAVVVLPQPEMLMQVEKTEARIVEQPTELQTNIKEEIISDEVVDAAEDDLDVNNVIFIGYEQLDQSLIGSKIQYGIQQTWTPPVGMSKDTTCEIRISILKNGQPGEAKVIKSSGAFVFDASARKALLSIEYPQEVWNKTITIALGT